MDEIFEMPMQEETRKVLMRDYEWLENYKHSTGHPFIKQICQHKKSLILEYLRANTLQRSHCK